MQNTLPRITTRVNLETQELLAQAASLSGISSINSFVLNAAIEKAKKIIKEEQLLKLTKRDAMMLIDALETPARSHSRLQEAVSRYNNKIHQ